KAVLEQGLGIEEPFFVYPYGRVGNELVSSIKKAGFNSAFIIGERYATADSDLYHIPRFTIAPRIRNEEFISILEGKGLIPME
ncbi:MAG: hypothetical protein Q4C00_08065, partial [Bacillota bacterium]|nr:hypothetical protein [Bacillota bacterium]